MVEIGAFAHLKPFLRDLVAQACGRFSLGVTPRVLPDDCAFYEALSFHTTCRAVVEVGSAIFLFASHAPASVKVMKPTSQQMALGDDSSDVLRGALDRLRPLLACLNGRCEAAEDAAGKFANEETWDAQNVLLSDRLGDGKQIANQELRDLNSLQRWFGELVSRYYTRISRRFGNETCRLRMRVSLQEHMAQTWLNALLRIVEFPLTPNASLRDMLGVLAREAWAPRAVALWQFALEVWEFRWYMPIDPDVGRKSTKARGPLCASDLYQLDAGKIFHCVYHPQRFLDALQLPDLVPPSANPFQFRLHPSRPGRDRRHVLCDLLRNLWLHKLSLIDVDEHHSNDEGVPRIIWLRVAEVGVFVGATTRFLLEDCLGSGLAEPVVTTARVELRVQYHMIDAWDSRVLDHRWSSGSWLQDASQQAVKGLPIEEVDIERFRGRDGQEHIFSAALRVARHIGHHVKVTLRRSILRPLSGSSSGEVSEPIARVSRSFFVKDSHHSAGILEKKVAVLPSVTRPSDFRASADCADLGFIDIFRRKMCLSDRGVYVVRGYAKISRRLTANSSSGPAWHDIPLELPGLFVHRSQSGPASATLADRSLDLVFIDGDHSYAGVTADWRSYEQKLVASVHKKSVLAGHDYNLQGFPGVVQAVSEQISCTPGATLYLDADTCWWKWNQT